MWTCSRATQELVPAPGAARELHSRLRICTARKILTSHLQPCNSSRVTLRPKYFPPESAQELAPSPGTALEVREGLTEEEGLHGPYSNPGTTKEEGLELPFDNITVLETQQGLYHRTYPEPGMTLGEAHQSLAALGSAREVAFDPRNAPPLGYRATMIEYIQTLL